MKTKSVRVVVLLSTSLMLYGTVRAQDSYTDAGIHSIDTPVDPRSVSMAESFVALRVNRSALMFNPAGLASLRGITASYSQRKYNWFSPFNLKYYQVNLCVGTSIGSFAFLYNRFDTGDITIATSGNPPGTITGRNYDQTFALGFGRTLGEYVAVGITVKTYMTTEEFSFTSPVSTDKTRPFVADIGAIFSHPALLDGLHQRDEYSVGMSLQNYGTDFRVKETSTSILGTTTGERLVKLPRYLRAGFSYSLSLDPNTENGLVPFHFLLTGEYRRLLNPGRSQEDDCDYWGLGVEASLFEILTGRISGFINHINSLYSLRGVPQLRYGIGVSAPLDKIGLAVPLLVRIEYAGLPIHDPGFIRPDVTTLKVFSFEVSYGREFF